MIRSTTPLAYLDANGVYVDPKAADSADVKGKRARQVRNGGKEKSQAMHARAADLCDRVRAANAQHECNMKRKADRKYWELKRKGKLQKESGKVFSTTDDK